MQLDVAVPTPQLREVRLGHALSVAFSFGVDRVCQASVENLAARNFQRKNERWKVALHLERVFGQTSPLAAVRGFTVRRVARHIISPYPCY